MDSLIKFKRVLITQMLILAAVVAVGALALGYTASAKGFILGTFFSIFNFLLMIRQAPGRLVEEGRKKATFKSGYGIGLRMIILAAPVYIAFQLPGIDVLFTAIGIFNLQISILIYGLLVERFTLTGGPTAQGR